MRSSTEPNERSPPRRASSTAARVVALGTFTSKGSAFSAATRVRRTRTASEMESPMSARAFSAFAFTFSSSRT